MNYEQELLDLAAQIKDQELASITLRSEVLQMKADLELLEAKEYIRLKEINPKDTVDGIKSKIRESSVPLDANIRLKSRDLQIAEAELHYAQNKFSAIKHILDAQILNAKTIAG